jgi:hypothetical protein
LFWRFSFTDSSLPSASLSTGHYPLAPRVTLHAPPSAGTSGVRSCADPPPLATLTPTAELPKSERGPIPTSTPSILVCHRNRGFLRISRISLSYLTYFESSDDAEDRSRTTFCNQGGDLVIGLHRVVYWVLRASAASLAAYDFSSTISEPRDYSVVSLTIGQGHRDAGTRCSR